MTNNVTFYHVITMKLPNEVKGPIYLPIETIARELDGKLLLAAGAISRGYAVIIGTKGSTARIAKCIGRGINLDKDHDDRIVESKLRALTEAGVHCTALDEEGLVYLNRDCYINERIFTGFAFDYLDLVFSWGEDQNNILTTYTTNRRAKTIITGNPRFDLLRHPFQKYYYETYDFKTIKKRYNKFILINTNFGQANPAHFYGCGFVELMRNSGRINTDIDEQYYQGAVRYYEQLYGHYVNMVKNIAKQMDEINIIVRPHPSEEHSTWKNDLSGLPNIHIIADGSVVNWILAAQAVIHTGCTTGIEAFVAGRPVLRYNPIYNSQYEPPLPNTLGEGYSEISALIMRIKEILTYNELHEHNPDQLNHLKRHVFNSSGDYAYARILDEFDRIAEICETCKLIENISIGFKLKNQFLIQLINFSRRHEATLAQVLPPSSLSKLTKRTQKFPGLSTEDIKQRLNKIFEIAPNIKVSPFEVKEIMPDTFIIYPSK